MLLKSLTYVEHIGDQREWTLERLGLGDVNLVVGVNASGKSRTLAAVGNLAWLVSAKMKPDFRVSDSSWDALFEHEGKDVRYTLSCRQSKVVEEKFSVGAADLMTRGNGGTGRIKAVKEDKVVDFQTPDTDLAVVARRDSIQHGFFEPLHEWATSVYRYQFGSLLGKQTVAVEIPNVKVALDARNQEETINIFCAGDFTFKSAFKESIKADMARLKYPIDEIGTTGPTAIPVASFPGPAKYLFVKERELACMTEQSEMSQGMFRALSVIIHLTYAQMASKPACVIIDDIGEGLDFDRSCAIIELLSEKVKSAGIQLIMSTNDRFVMNRVPLEAWTVLKRCKGAVQVFNYQNSKKYFDEFRFTGMNNFDFFAMDFLSEDLGNSEGASHEEAGSVC